MERCAIGIDLGGTKINGGLVTQTGSIRTTVRRPTPVQEGASGVLQAMKNMVAELLNQAGDLQVMGIGLGVPGVLDRRAGTVILSPNLAWHNVPVTEAFREFGLPVDMDNDVRCHTLGELHFGAARGFRDFLLITLGTGIGAGIVVNGQLYRGGSGMAGEIGHIPLRPGGPLCGCGKRGCFEALASGKSIGRRAQEAGIADSARSLFEKAASGNQAAKDLVEQVVYDLALGISTYINLMNPKRVIVGGGVSMAGDLLFEPLRRFVEQEVMPGIRGTYDIVPAKFGTEAGVVGAASLIPGLTGDVAGH